MSFWEFLERLPPVGWIAVFLIIAMFSGFLFLLLHLIAKKELRFKNIELISPQAKKIVELGVRDLLENQSVNAKNLLSKIWIDIYETGIRIFNITETPEKWILNNIAQLIDHKLQYAVHLDLMRNHIQEKEVGDLMRYADAKAEGYYRMVKTLLHHYNIQLPRYPLSEILSHITATEFKKIFEQIYMSSCNIAGRGGNK